MRKGKEETLQDKSTSKYAVFPEIPLQIKTLKNPQKKEEELDLPELEIPTYSQDPYQQTTVNLAKNSQPQKSSFKEPTTTTESLRKLKTSSKSVKQQNTTLTGIGNQKNETIKSKVERLDRQPSNLDITLEDLDQRLLSPQTVQTPRQDKKPVAVETLGEDKKPVAVGTPTRLDHSVPTREEKLLKLLKETDKLLGDLDSNSGSDNNITSSEEENARGSFYEEDDEEDDDDNNLDLRITNAAAAAVAEEEEEKAKILQLPRRSEKTTIAELTNVKNLFESKKPKRKNQENEKLKSEIEDLPRQLSNQSITVDDLDQQLPVAEVSPRQDEKPVAVETPEYNPSFITKEENLRKLLEKTKQLLRDSDSDSEEDHPERKPFSQEITLDDFPEPRAAVVETPRQDEKPAAVVAPRQGLAVTTKEEELPKLSDEASKLLGDFDSGSDSDNNITKENMQGSLENTQESFNEKEKTEEQEEDEEEDEEEVELSIINEPAVTEEQDMAIHLEPQIVSIDEYLAKVKSIGSTQRSAHPTNKEQQMISLFRNQTKPDSNTQKPDSGITFDIQRNEATRGLERQVLLALKQLQARKEEEITHKENIKITQEIQEIKKLINYADNNIKIHCESEPIHTSLQLYLMCDNLVQAEKLLNFIKENQERNQKEIRKSENLLTKYINPPCSCTLDYTALHFVADLADPKSYPNFKKFIKKNLDIPDKELTSLDHKNNSGRTPDELYQYNNLPKKIKLKSEKLAEIKKYFTLIRKTYTAYRAIRECFWHSEKDKNTRLRHYAIFRTIQEINSENKVFENQQDPTKDYLTSVLEIVTSLNAIFCKGTLNFQNVQRYINPKKEASKIKKEISSFKEALNIYLLSKDTENNSILHHAAACVKTAEDYTKYRQLETGLARFLTKPAYSISNDLDIAPARPNPYAKTYYGAKEELNKENITAQKPEDIIFEKLPELKPKTPAAAPARRTLAIKMGLPPKTPAAAPARRTLGTKMGLPPRNK